MKRSRSRHQEQLQPFTLCNVVFPRDIGRIILRTGIFTTADPTERELLLILWRTVCKMWWTLLDISLLKERSKRLIFTLYEDRDKYASYYPAISYIVTLGYPLNLKNPLHPWRPVSYSGTSIKAVENDDIDSLRHMIPLEPRLKPIEIWNTAIDYDAINVIQFMIPVIMFHHGTMVDSFSRALRWAKKIETIELVVNAFPIPKVIPYRFIFFDNEAIPIDKEKWCQVIDLLYEKYDETAIVKWFMGLVKDGNHRLVEIMIHHVGQVDSRLCAYLKRGDRDKNKKLHGRLRRICDCEK